MVEKKSKTATGLVGTAFIWCNCLGNEEELYKQVTITNIAGAEGVCAGSKTCPGSALETH